MSVKRDELIKYITGRIVQYIDAPKPKEADDQIRARESWKYRWFGMLPVAWNVWKSRWKPVKWNLSNIRWRKKSARHAKRHV